MEWPLTESVFLFCCESGIVQLEQLFPGGRGLVWLAVLLELCEVLVEPVYETATDKPLSVLIWSGTLISFAFPRLLSSYRQRVGVGLRVDEIAYYFRSKSLGLLLFDCVLEEPGARDCTTREHTDQQRFSGAHVGIVIVRRRQCVLRGFSLFLLADAIFKILLSRICALCSRFESRESTCSESI